ncbi:LptA/OstA family protein [Frigidibacter sp. ROC022]|uniref:LptA/OstA family protein n=1 Tax=Frigidibacter sp. ROC022 TaxID=2971796 RepID=UPI00215A5095|nr:LptA/OstA family protein [Frigidibacter sp. ROC022]MCR8724407.1 lipopolysaccharide transport periplasmic protein LptA [Frigidibacter sp. ROC022]
MALSICGGALAQGASFPFGDGLAGDSSAPVEIEADSLSISQTDGTATFQGNVLVAQGDLRLSAGAVRVEYSAGTDGKQGDIKTLFASGGVTLVSGTEAAEASEAVYAVDTGIVTMTGKVLLTQGRNVISGEKLRVDLGSGTGTMEGRVRTVLQPGDN